MTRADEAEALLREVSGWLLTASRELAAIPLSKEESGVARGIGVRTLIFEASKIDAFLSAQKDNAAPHSVTGQTTGLPDEPRNPERGCAAAAPSADAVMAVLREARGEIMHSRFNHDYEKDADRCPRCAIVERVDAMLAAAPASKGKP